MVGNLLLPLVTAVIARMYSADWLNNPNTITPSEPKGWGVDAVPMMGVAKFAIVLRQISITSRWHEHIFRRIFGTMGPVKFGALSTSANLPQPTHGWVIVPNYFGGSLSNGMSGWSGSYQIRPLMGLGMMTPQNHPSLISSSCKIWAL